MDEVPSSKSICSRHFSNLAFADHGDSLAALESLSIAQNTLEMLAGFDSQACSFRQAAKQISRMFFLMKT